MKLCLSGCDYKYAAEQIMLTMFPQERPEYINNYDGEDNCAVISLKRAAVYATATVKIVRDGKTAVGIARVNENKLTGKLETDRILQRLLKNAFYKASIRLTGAVPPWGALTGIRPGIIATKLLENGVSEKEAEKTMEREYFVTKQRAEFTIATARASLAVKNSLLKNDIALYIGIPFCPTRCAYCSFVSHSIEKSASLIPLFVTTLLREIEETGEIIKENGLRVIAVYFGGGTPTTLSPEQLTEIIDKLYASVDMSAVREFTVEAGRPDTITEEKLRVLKDKGVNRISINPQTMSDEVLRLIGRRHTEQEVYWAYDLARKTGFEGINMDLIAGLPGDTAEDFERTITKALSLAPENITVHTLSLKKGARIMLEGTKIPDGDCVGKMLDTAAEKLSPNGYKPYYLYRQKFISGGFENIGWSKEGFSSLYNILIMEEQCSVIAMGGGASTKLVNGKTGRIERIFNPKYPKEYIESIDRTLEKKNKITEFYREISEEK